MSPEGGTVSKRLLRGPAIIAGLLLVQGSDLSCSAGGDSLGPGVNGEVSGVVILVEIEGGCWTLRADDGTVYELVTDQAPPQILVHGAEVTLLLQPRKNAVSRCMIGRIAEVERVVSLRLP